MVHHERAHERRTRIARQPLRRVVDRFVKPVAAGCALAGKASHVGNRRVRLDHQRHHRSVRCDDEIRRKTALQSKAWHAERSVLIIECSIEAVKARFRDAPRDVALMAVFDLLRNRGPTALLEQRSAIARHHEHRHQILEHRSAPRRERRSAGDRHHAAPEREPALHRNLSLRDRDEAAKPRFGREQIEVTLVVPVLIHVVADRQQFARIVVQEGVVHARHRARLLDPLLEFFEALARTRARRAIAGRNAATAGKVSQARYCNINEFARRLLADPGREIHQLLASTRALADERVHPIRGFTCRNFDGGDFVGCSFGFRVLIFDDDEPQGRRTSRELIYAAPHRRERGWRRCARTLERRVERFQRGGLAMLIARFAQQPARVGEPVEPSLIEYRCARELLESARQRQ